MPTLVLYARRQNWTWDRISAPANDAVHHEFAANDDGEERRA